MRAVVFRGKDAGWYFHLLADNNEIVADSEGHEHKTDAIEMARQLLPPGSEIEVSDG